MADLSIIIALLAFGVSVYFGFRNAELQARINAIEKTRRVDDTPPSFALELRGAENTPVVTFDGPDEVTALRVEVVHHEMHPTYFRKVWVDGGSVVRMRVGDTRALRSEVDASGRGGVLKLRLSGATYAGRFKDVIVEAAFTHGADAS
jgi:hypothetical protein